jgi:hypothetical protein
MLENIRNCFKREAVLFTRHAAVEMEQEELGEISTAEVYESVLDGECIREYSEDKPLPSCLILGFTRNRRPIHVVCAHDEVSDRAIVITVYEPSATLWANYRERK